MKVYRLFTFEDKEECELISPIPLKEYFTEENLTIVLDTFYEIEQDLNEEKTLEIIILANYFLAVFLSEKLIKNYMCQLGSRPLSLNDEIRIKELVTKIKELSEFSNQWNVDEFLKIEFKMDLFELFSLK